uniref:ATP synthase complex subunit 8 n=1 Tax=Cryptotermes sp. 1 AB-2022a TaxID=2942704 RepID=A0A8X8RGP0_9NEOP|nr:ATP synthase F0 subunit 8 [Cryptotermes sp. 1 AB-2022a]URX52731.1 ATP synthase F0 subunit 8 [Cryptotermes sp. 1 AB-2022a]
MPQMMPLSWLSLFIMFSATLILFSTLNYYAMIIKTSTTEKKEITNKILNWKW